MSVKVQRSGSGKVARTLAAKAARAEAGTTCCCSPLRDYDLLIPCDPEAVFWTCRDPETFQIATSRSDCRWISGARSAELIQDAIDAGHAVAGTPENPGGGVAEGHPCFGAGLGDLVVYDSLSEACYRVWFGSPWISHDPPNGFVADDFVTYVNLFCYECCYSAPSCPCEDDNPIDPPPPPPPEDCEGCGVLETCEHCECTPDYGIRCFVVGLQACATCITGCGNGPGYSSSRLDPSQSMNGTYDMTRVNDCEWKAFTTRDILHADEGEPDCVVVSTTTITLHLKKMSATQWVFAIYVQDMDPDDPREFAANDGENWRFFVGSRNGTEDECMTIPTISNVTPACACVASATSDGRFDLSRGGAAFFQVLCP